MIEKVVKELFGVEDAPKWLEKEVLRKIEESGMDVQSAVHYLAPLIAEVHRANISKYRPGGSSIRKASVYLTAELLERWGYKVEFVELFGTTLPAAVRGEGRYVPVVPIFDTKKKSKYLAAKSKRLMHSIIQISATPEAEGVVAEVLRVEKPPYYYLYTYADIGKLVEEARPLTATVNKKRGKIYSYWKFFRERGYLVLVGREIGGIAVDLLAVGLGKYAVVSGNSGKKVARLRKFVDAIYLV